MRFQDKVAVVTGGATGIGRASAVALAREGAKVVVADVNATEGAATVRRIKDAKGEALFVHVDVSKSADWTRAAGIRVNAVCPGFIRTPMVEAGLTPDALTQIAQLHALGRLGESDEVANLVLFLASEESSFLTGAAYLVDGGYTAR